MMPLPTYGDIYPMPPGMWPFPYQIIKKGTDATGKNIWASNVPWDALQPAGTDYYVSMTGASGNNGLSPGAPLDTILHVLAKPGPWRIHLMEAGDWDNAKINHPLANISLSMSIVCDAGVANLLGCNLGVTWIASAFYVGVYFLADTNVCQVRDTTNLDASGKQIALVDVADPPTVALTANSEFIGTGLDGAGVYVRTFDSRSPIGNNTLHANLSTSEFRFRNGTTGVTAYYKNLYWQGVQHVTNRVLSGVSRLTVIMDNCESDYTLDLSANPGGFEYLGTISLMRNCRGFQNRKDGANYHNSGTVCWFYEEDCTFNDNGGDGLGNNNGSTCHDGSLGIRLRTTAYRNEGPNIADVSAGTITLNIQCDAGNSVRATAGNNYTAGGDGGGGTKMYLDQCNSVGSVTDCITASGGTIHYIATRTFTNNGSAGTCVKVPNIESLYR